MLFSTSHLQYWIFFVGVKHCIDAFEEIFVKVYKHEVQNNSAQHRTFAELLLVLSNQPLNTPSFVDITCVNIHALVVVEWLFCVISPNLKVLQGINQQYWFVTGWVVVQWESESHHQPGSISGWQKHGTVHIHPLGYWHRKPSNTHGRKNPFNQILFTRSTPKGEYTSSFCQS